jgi:hypothetical protein
MFGFSPIQAVLILWGIVTTLLIVLLIYRSMISMKEDDQLFLDSAQSNLEQEQRQVRTQLERLAPYTKVLGATSGLLLVGMAGMWLYQQLSGQGLLPH